MGARTFLVEAEEDHLPRAVDVSWIGQRQHERGADDDRGRRQLLPPLSPSARLWRRWRRAPPRRGPPSHLGVPGRWRVRRSRVRLLIPDVGLLPVVRRGNLQHTAVGQSPRARGGEATGRRQRRRRQRHRRRLLTTRFNVSAAGANVVQHAKPHGGARGCAPVAPDRRESHRTSSGHDGQHRCRVSSPSLSRALYAFVGVL